MQELSKLMIDNVTYSIKDRAAREKVNNLSNSLDNTKINGKPIKGQNIILDAEGLGFDIDAISYQEIDGLFYGL